jgi:tuftelin-interacting protein 11
LFNACLGEQVFSDSDLDAIIHRAILPKLVQAFRHEFAVNPAAQDLSPLEWTLDWVSKDLLSVPVAVHLLETELFPKWHKVLWVWLSSPSVNFEEVSGWYTSWKALFPPSLLPSLQGQFRFGLDMMNLALTGGPESLKVMPPLPTPLAAQPLESESRDAPKKQPTARPQLTFVDYLQRAAGDRGIEFTPMAGKSHPLTGKPLYRLSSGRDGTAQLTVYIDQGLLFVRLPNVPDWEPMPVDQALELVS